MTQVFLLVRITIRKIQFLRNERQFYYNSEIKKGLIKKKWLCEQPVVNDKNIRLKCDYRKEDLQLEVEFGNARTYYQDLIKFVISYNAGIIRIGGLIVPSNNFAKHLCELGRRNATFQSNRIRSYSGMMDFKKASLEFKYIKELFRIPFFILSIDSKLR